MGKIPLCKSVLGAAKGDGVFDAGIETCTVGTKPAGCEDWWVDPKAKSDKPSYCMIDNTVFALVAGKSTCNKHCDYFTVTYGSYTNNYCTVKNLLSA